MIDGVLSKVAEKNGASVYKTKGDANNATDSWDIAPDKILGKDSFKVPLAGNIITFTKTPLGLVTLIILPGTMIAYSELMNIVKEIKKLFVKGKSDHDTKA